jgi:hypothetical protein
VQKPGAKPGFFATPIEKMTEKPGAARLGTSIRETSLLNPRPCRQKLPTMLEDIEHPDSGKK